MYGNTDTTLSSAQNAHRQLQVLDKTAACPIISFVRSFVRSFVSTNCTPHATIPFFSSHDRHTGRNVCIAYGDARCYGFEKLYVPVQFFNSSFPYGKHRMPERTGQTPRVRRLARRRYRNCTSVRNSDLEFAPQTRLLTAFPTSCRNNSCNSGGGRGRKKTALNGVFSPPKRNFGFFKGVKVGRTPIEEKGTSSFLRKQKYSKPKNVQDVHSWAPFPFCSCFCTVCAYN